MNNLSSKSEKRYASSDNTTLYKHQMELLQFSKGNWHAIQFTPKLDSSVCHSIFVNVLKLRTNPYCGWELDASKYIRRHLFTRPLNMSTLTVKQTTPKFEIISKTATTAISTRRCIATITQMALIFHWTFWLFLHWSCFLLNLLYF